MVNKKVTKKNKEKESVLKINKDWTISEIFKRFPNHIDELSDVMSDYGLHCAGCNANQFETLAEGIEGHGFDEDLLISLIDDLNNVIKNDKSKSDSSDDLLISKSALSKLSDILSRKSKELKKSVYLRVNYNSSDDICYKDVYSLGFESKVSKNDVLVDTNDDVVKIVLAKNDLDYFKGLVVDYVDNEEMTGFKITTSINDGGCGCSH